MVATLDIQADAPIKTWFAIGGTADRYAEPSSHDHLAEALRLDPDLRILGDGANLLVADEGVSELVCKLSGELASWSIDPGSGRVTAGAGANLPKLIHATVRAGLAGIHTLGGVPATLGGATVMNAGGAHGQIADAVHTIRALTRTGDTIDLARDQVRFDYRHSGLTDLIITAVTLHLEPGHDKDRLRTTLKDIMAAKKASQPLAASSCGCVFKNPTPTHDIEGIASANTRTPAGLLIDRAGCKGMTPHAQSVRVSNVHANFFETASNAKAADVIELIERVQDRVEAAFSIRLEPELVIWKRTRPRERDTNRVTP